ncbi:MAG: sigma-70 family RNA polymerase sigma factor [Sphingomonadales bacterium]|nr:sigma-70 family RNA polymerase sigma factor [Sphingomonadales bacterium]
MMRSALIMSIHEGKTGPRDNAAAMARLVVRVAEARDRAAFEQLFRHFAPRVKSFMLHKGADRETAEELAQETMLRLWRKAHLYRPSKSAVSSWVFTIARNLRIDRMRRESIRQYEDIGDYDAPSTDPISDDLVGRRQESAALSESLAQLPSEQTEVMRLAFIDDLSQREIADRLDLPLGTVKSRMRLAYAKLRVALEGDL